MPDVPGQRKTDFDPVKHFVSAVAAHLRLAEYTVKSWNTDQGLPQSGVLCLLPTRDGYLWVGTYNGLARFDGLSFTSFTVQNTTALLSDQITRLVEDRAGALWIATMEGFVRFQGGKFERLGSAQGLPVEPIHDPCLDATETLWIAAESRLLHNANGGSKVCSARREKCLRGSG